MEASGRFREVLFVKAGWKMFLLFAAIFAAASGAERLLIPHVVPIGFTEEPQPLWSVEAAFVLRAVELMSGAVAIISLALMFAAWARELRHRRAP
jgi:hypothetical protein